MVTRNSGSSDSLTVSSDALVFWFPALKPDRLAMSFWKNAPMVISRRTSRWRALADEKESALLILKCRTAKPDCRGAAPPSPNQMHDGWRGSSVRKTKTHSRARLAASPSFFARQPARGLQTLTSRSRPSSTGASLAPPPARDACIALSNKIVLAFRCPGFGVAMHVSR